MKRSSWNLAGVSQYIGCQSTASKKVKDTDWSKCEMETSGITSILDILRKKSKKRIYENTRNYIIRSLNSMTPTTLILPAQEYIYH